MTEKFLHTHHALAQVDVIVAHLVKESELKREGLVGVA